MNSQSQSPYGQVFWTCGVTRPVDNPFFDGCGSTFDNIFARLGIFCNFGKFGTRLFPRCTAMKIAFWTFLKHIASFSNFVRDQICAVFHNARIGEDLRAQLPSMLEKFSKYCHHPKAQYAEH